jgi:hypothetical protein
MVTGKPQLQATYLIESETIWHTALELTRINLELSRKHREKLAMFEVDRRWRQESERMLD